MPNRDGTGPTGDGRPGRGLGNCGKSPRRSSITRNTEERRIVESGAELLINIVRSLLNKKTNQKRS